MVFQIVYKSEPTRVFESDDCTDILLASRRNNPKNGITGALIFTGLHFVQALEGPEHSVRAIYKSVSRDPRHTNVTCLVQEEIEQAEFGPWSMAFERTHFGKGVDLERQLQSLTENASEDTRATFERFLKKATS